MRIIGLLLSLLFSSNLLAATCSDDPRLYVMRTVMDDLAAGKAIPPLKLMPMTYLNLNGNLRKKLADNIVVMNEQCVPVQVVDGQLPTRANLTYEDLLYGLFSALSAEDDAAVNIIMSSFQAAPRSTQDIFYLIRELDWPAQHLARAINLGVLTLPRLHDDDKDCSKQTAAVTHVDLYQRLGGQSYDKDYIIQQRYDNNYVSRQKASNDDYTEFNSSVFVFKSCDRHPISSIVSALVSMGIKTPIVHASSNSRDFFNENPAPKVKTDG